MSCSASQRHREPPPEPEDPRAEAVLVHRHPRSLSAAGLAATHMDKHATADQKRRKKARKNYLVNIHRDEIRENIFDRAKFLCHEAETSACTDGSRFKAS